jgi:hypothetical protein
MSKRVGTLRDAILAQFDPQHATALIEFGKQLAMVEADIMVFMARKALCLYDLLLRLGAPPREGVVVSDRVLDMSLAPFRGRRVALVDDTLIVGTTLAKTKYLLEREAKAEVTTHTLCTDLDWWCRDLVDPDTNLLELDDRAVMTLCGAEVRAMSLLPRPYLVDFPSSTPVRIKVAESQQFLSAVEWSAHNISTELQRRHGVFVWTFLPTECVAEQLAQALGDSLASCVDIVKVRAFARRHQGSYWTTFVPIVTLKPLRSDAAARLLDAVLAQVATVSGKDLARLTAAAETPQGQCRLAQYALSVAVGSGFLRSVEESVNSRIERAFDVEDAGRHFGPWLHDELAVVCRVAGDALIGPQRQTWGANVPVSPCDLPPEVEVWNRVEEEQVDTERTKGRQHSNLPRNIVSAVTEVFLDMFRTREIPAREEAKALGRAILVASPKEAPNRDRLEIGLPWSMLSRRLLTKLGVSDSPQAQTALSLALDVGNDLGTLVPITCLRDGIVFRAYRHGEDVRFSDGELSLSYELVRGALKGQGRPSLPRLTLEKLLVLMVKIGPAMRFLEPVYGTSGCDGVVRVGFYLKGAVPILSRGPKDRADKDIWLSKYLLERSVLRLDESGKYALGTNVDGHFVRSDAPFEAYQLGVLVGLLLGGEGKESRKPLTPDGLTLLATCWHPRHTTAALQVELSIFCEWYGRVRRKLLRADWSDWASLEAACSTMTSAGGGHEAVHASRFKYVGYARQEPRRIVEACERFLDETSFSPLDGGRWRNYWQALDNTQAKGERERFDPWSSKLASMCWEMAACLAIVEIAIRARQCQVKGLAVDRRVKVAIAKFIDYNKAMAGVGLQETTLVKRLKDRYRTLVAGGYPSDFDCKGALMFAIERVDTAIPRMEAAVEAVDPLIEDFGRLVGRHDYKYMVYYDIIDSTATVRGATGGDVQAYRARVRRFKGLANGVVRRLSRVAGGNEGEVYAWGGDSQSSNDCKHLFVSGKFASRYVNGLLEGLCQAAIASEDVRLRLYALPCDFAGTSAYRREGETEVCGETFWEHWSRLLKAGAALEKECGAQHSVLLVATEAMAAKCAGLSGWEWADVKEKTVTTEIEMLKRSVVLWYGVLRGNAKVGVQV